MLSAGIAVNAAVSKRTNAASILALPNAASVAAAMSGRNRRSASSHTLARRTKMPPFQ
jgi:hypothetical protein